VKRQILWTVLAWAAIVLLAAAGCQRAPAAPGTTQEPADDASPLPQPARTEPGSDVSPLPPPGSATSPLPAPVGTAEAVHAAQADLAEQLGVEAAEIQVVSVEAVEWPDASLGCPQPGMMYAQVITPGFLVVLEAEGARYEYHTDQGGSVVLCEKEAKVDMPTTPSAVEPGLESLIERAKEDLARRLSISVDQIVVLEARSVVWPDGGLGCPQPGMAYAQVPREGVLIRLRAEQRIYSYHGGAGTPPFLCERATTGDAP